MKKFTLTFSALFFYNLVDKHYYVGGDYLIAQRIYLQPRITVINTILDILELQKGKSTLSDSQNGRLHFAVSMYGCKWEYQIGVADIGQNRSLVRIGVVGNTKNKKRHIIREFALLDSMLIGEAQMEFIEEESIPTEEIVNALSKPTG